MKPHPDRLAATLAQRHDRPTNGLQGPFQKPGPGSQDARVDVKLLAFEAREALARRGTKAAQARIADLEGDDLWAGTVQDGTARGLMVALEETISLCDAPDQETTDPSPEQIALGEVREGKDLRRVKDMVVASGGARVRFSRKGGLLMVDRAFGLHVENAVCFEDSSDRGSLDRFVPDESERPRLFHPGFLLPVRWERNEVRDLLLLEGRLGRGPRGFPCRMRLEGRKGDQHIQMSVAVENRHPDHRLRIRFVGFPESASIKSRGTPGWEEVLHRGRRFVAATLVRACGRLEVGEESVAVPGAQCLGWIEHHFSLAGGPA